jgi:atypical dual specificity phosphatase
MTSIELTEPRLLAGIRNFGWVRPGVLARGEQPPLEAATFEALHEQGIRTVMSLRPDREPPPVAGRRLWPEYHAEEEQQLVEAAGMQFRHVELEDFAAPAPHEVAQALTVLDEAVKSNPAVYVHCRAGAGRAAVISGTWLIANGGSGDEAARLYARFMDHIVTTIGFSADQTAEMQRRVGQPYVWWSLQQIASALGTPVTREFALLPPEQPARAEGWPEAYRELLRPWRKRREQQATNGAAAAD